VALAWVLLSGGCHKESGKTVLDPPEPIDTSTPGDTNAPGDTNNPIDTGGAEEPQDTVDLPRVDTLDFPIECPPKPNRDTLDCPPPYNPGWICDIISQDLLSNPVYSPLDNCVYYEDTGVDSAYFAIFVHSVGNNDPIFEIQPGIYRLRLDDESPAELVAAGGLSPNITPDGSTLYYIDAFGGIGNPSICPGPIMRKRLPDGQLELVSNKPACWVWWYAPDTLATLLWDGHKYLLDMKTDSLREIPACGLPDCCQRRCSPDSTEIVFDLFSVNTGYQIRVTDLAGNQRILAYGGGKDYPCGCRVAEPTFAMDGQYILYIKNSLPMDPWFLYPCSWNASPTFDGQIWIMSAVDGSGKRQVSTWSRIRP